MSNLYHATNEFRCGHADKSYNTIENACTPQYALVYLWQGEASLTYGEKEYKVIAGQVFQRFPEKAHQVVYLESSKTFFVALPFQVYDLFKQIRVPTINQTVLTIGNQKQLLQQHQKLMQWGLLKEPEQIFDPIHTGMEWMMNIHRLARKNQLKQRNVEWLQEAYSILSQNLSDKMKMEEIATKLGLGYSSFRKIFKDESGYSPTDYRIHLKINQAKNLLMQEVPVSEVSTQLGYSDIYAFSSQFKSFCGVSPREWLKNNFH